MSRITDMFKGLMFLQGHFTRPDDLDPSFPLGNRAASERWFAGKAGTGARTGKPATGLNLLDHLSFLGGRPMHAGHNLDIEEPFEQFATARGAANDDALRQCASC